MTIDEMREITGIGDEASDAAVVAAYAALVDDGIPASIPIVEPVTVEQARAQCRIDDDVEDDLIAQKIRSAREWCEDLTSRVIAQQTLVEHFSSWGDYLTLFKRPVISIDAIAYNGEAGDETYTGASAAIGVYPTKIYPATGGWPILKTGGGITVAYTAGFDAGEVPNRFIEAILVIVGGMMVEREGAYMASLVAARALLKPRGSQPAIA